MSPSKKILIVDDDPYIVEFLVAVLEAEGYSVVTAADGLEALAQMGRCAPSLVILDLCMPRMSGEQFLSRLRESGCDPAVIVMTAMDDARLLARKLGAQGWLQKPFDLDTLLEVVSRLAG